MTAWLIEPRDPLIARDGRPIGGSAPIRTLDFPFPSTIAGIVRGRLGSPRGSFLFRGDSAALAELRRIEVRGPFLAEVTSEGEVEDWLFPAPRDAQIGVDEGDARLRVTPLAPVEAEGGVHVPELAEEGLQPLAAVGGFRKAKPPHGRPAFWSWSDMMLPWLVEPRSLVALPAGSGAPALPRESRTHVVLRPGERVSDEGDLFSTVGLRFAIEGRAPSGGDERRHFALTFSCPGGQVGRQALALREELAAAGGERRLAWFRPAKRPWPEPPSAVVDGIAATRRARVVLATPAIFADGFLPGWRRRPWPDIDGLEVHVQAAAVGEPAVVSGWDLEHGRPKPTRRAAPAGSVYFVRLEGSAALCRRWAEQVWLQGVADGEQDRVDGYGLALLGTWPADLRGRL